MEDRPFDNTGIEVSAIGVADGQGLPQEQVEALQGHRWERNFYA